MDVRSLQAGKVSLQVELRTGDEREAQCLVQLNGVLERHDLSRWIFTQEIAIQVGAIPHSHPVLTLNTRHLKQDDLLLSTFLHEQIHWYAVEQYEAVSAAMGEFRVLYPSAPVGFPQGAEDEESTYLHLFINWLEHYALQGILGEERAREVIEHWSTDHYTWVYREVLQNRDQIESVLHRHGLVSRLPAAATAR